MAANAVADIIYGMSFQARTGMGDSLDYGVVIEVMDQLGIEGQERVDVLQKIMIAEQSVREQMSKNSKQSQETVKGWRRANG